MLVALPATNLLALVGWLSVLTAVLLVMDLLGRGTAGRLVTAAMGLSLLLVTLLSGEFRLTVVVLPTAALVDSLLAGLLTRLLADLAGLTDLSCFWGPTIRLLELLLLLWLLALLLPGGFLHRLEGLLALLRRLLTHLLGALLDSPGDFLY